ncbi:MAG: hypothetical protein HRU34_13490 [Richelia sp.]|nr:hypothetical protein [Richelia sp.]
MVASRFVFKKLIGIDYFTATMAIWVLEGRGAGRKGEQKGTRRVGEAERINSPCNRSDDVTCYNAG